VPDGRKIRHMLGRNKHRYAFLLAKGVGWSSLVIVSMFGGCLLMLTYMMPINCVHVWQVPAHAHLCDA